MEAKHYSGLSEAEVRQNREKWGANILTPPRRKSLWKLFWEKFKDPIIRILLVAAALSLVISILHNEYAETIGIFAAIFLATGVGFWFEMDANQKFDLLNLVNDNIPYKVIRDKHVREVEKKEIVVGDIVILETGEEVPADGELLEAISLQVNESTLTGEPVTDKTTFSSEFDMESTYPSNWILRGTTVINGHCIYEVKTVGDRTEFGKVAEKAAEITEDQTPLGKQLEKLARLISIAGFVVAGATFIGLLTKDIITGVFTSGNLFTLDTAGRILQYFMVAVTLIVVSVPEGLPMSVTLSLALSMRKMLKTHNLVRKMHACETIGATTVICTDKTGTLTQNRMQVYRTDFTALSSQQLGSDEASLLIQEGISVNSTAYLEFTPSGEVKPLGNPTEAALLLWLDTQGVNYMDFREKSEIVEQLTFSTERKYMATWVHSVTRKEILYLKGAPEIVFGKCAKILTTEGLKPANDYRQYIEERLLQYQSQAMRTLALAYKMVSSREDGDIKKNIGDDFIFLGIVAISDPIRPDVPAAVDQCLRAGISVKIVTGDTPATAREIGQQIGIWQNGDTEKQLITGVDFEKLSDKEALKQIADLKIMCRARPTDKQRLVELLKRTGAVVAVTGDGTNDAPALNYADVGLSMGTGTSVAKEASDITLLDDSFHSIATAVMWGRSLYHNIQRFILFQLTINLSALLIVLLGSLFGHELPLTVTQMLWINMIIDTFAAAALASLPPDPQVMNEHPRKATDFIISKGMRNRIIGIGFSLTFILLGLMYYFTDDAGVISHRHLSIFFTTFVLLQFWNMFNAKAFLTKGSAFKGLSRCTGFLIVMAIIPTGQFLIVQFGGEVFRTVPLSVSDWAWIVGLSSVVLWAGELIRLCRRK